MARIKLPIVIIISGAVILAAVGPLAASSDQGYLWYRGYFDGKVEVKGSGPTPGYHYYPSPDATVPLLEYRYSYPLPCDKCGHYHKHDGYCPVCKKKCDGSGTHVTSEHVYRPYDLLPGAYYYKRQPHYNFSTPINVGWPYVKYNKRW